MTTDTTEVPIPVKLGTYLKSVRLGLDMTLRGVEDATNQDVSNAYLSQLENGKVAKPSPHILYSLSQVYGVSYEDLMQRAGYIAPTKKDRGVNEKHGRAATFAIEFLSSDEEQALLTYLAFLRSQRKGHEKT
jgi:HTH-type transcriptional regulator, competence development regulator